MKNRSKNLSREIMRIIFSLFLFLIVLLLTDSDAYAYKEISNSKSVKGYSKEISYVTEWFLKNDYGKKEISNPREMYSPDGEFVALCFDLNNSGYVILNVFNYDIMEFSFDVQIKNTRANSLLYTGFTEIYEKTGKDKCFDIMAREYTSLDSIRENAIDYSALSRKSLSNSFASLNGKTMINSAKVNGNSYHESGSLRNSLASWGTSYYYCQVDSTAILLKYLYDNRSKSFIPSGYAKNGDLQEYLCNNKYLFNCGLNSTNGGTRPHYVGAYLENVKFKGMKQYLKDMGISNWIAQDESYSFNTIKTMIAADKPVSVGVNSKHPDNTWGGAHQVVAHGYTVGYDRVPYILVNDTFGHNGVTLNASSQYYMDMDLWYMK